MIKKYTPRGTECPNIARHLSRGGREGRRSGASSTIRHRLFDVGVVLHGFHDCCHASTTLVRATNGEDGGEEDDKDDDHSQEEGVEGGGDAFVVAYYVVEKIG